jgi:hypothetical protein
MNPDRPIAVTAAQIAALLKETAPDPRRQIRRIVAKLGPARAQALAQEALRIEAAGGQVIPDGSRRRTVGGIFFQLVKQQTGGRRTRTRRQRALNRLPLLTWATRMNVVRDALAQKGSISDVKMTLVGRPGAVAVRPNCVLIAMANTRGPSLPKGLPDIPTTPTTYTVYIAHKHWRGMEEALTNPDDALVIEGWATYDPELEGIAVFATFVTTTLRRAQQKGSSDA